MIRAFPKWVVIWTFFAILLTNLAYLIGIFFTPADTTFTGNLLYIPDTFSYYANMQLGSNGYWLYRMPYSAQPNKPVLLFSMYLLLGQLAKVFHLSVPWMYHLARVALSIIFSLVGYRFLARYLESESERKLGFGILLFTGGLGWLMLLLFGVESSPFLIPDLWIFEATSFGSMAGYPHFILSVILMMVMINACQSLIESPSFYSIATGIGAGLGIALIHPQQLVITGVVAGLTVLFYSWNDRNTLLRNFFYLMMVFLPSLTLTAILTLQSKTDPYLSNWLEQGNTYSVPVWALFLLYGPVLLLAIVGFLYFLSTRKWETSPAALWFLIVPFLLYIPVNFQRRFIEGWQVPIVIMAALGWFRLIAPWISKKFGPRSARFGLTLLIVTVSLSPVMQLTGMIARAYFIQPLDLVYLSEEVTGAIDYLQANAECDDVILSGYKVGNTLPAYVCVKSLIGHTSLTPFFNERVSDVDVFYDPLTPNSQRKELIDEFNIRYIYFGEDEGNNGESYLDQARFLKLVYQNPKIAIYEIQRYDSDASEIIAP